MTDQRVLTVLEALEKKCVTLTDVVAKIQAEIQGLREELMRTGETGKFTVPGRVPPQPQRVVANPNNPGLPSDMR